MMRKFFLVCLCALISLGAQAQITAEEVMDKAADVMDVEKGFQTDMTMKIVGISVPMFVAQKGKKGLFCTEDGDIWSDGETVYTYEKAKNTVTIEKADHKKNADDDTMDFRDLTTGFSMSLQNSPEGYKIDLKKLKSNKDKDAPNSAEVIVNPNNFHPKSVKFKKGVMTMIVTYSNIKSPITDDAVTYNSSRYPNARIIDKR